MINKIWQCYYDAAKNVIVFDNTHTVCTGVTQIRNPPGVGL
jgi:hypothetical protein